MYNIFSTDRSSIIYQLLDREHAEVAVLRFCQISEVVILLSVNFKGIPQLLAEVMMTYYSRYVYAVGAELCRGQVERSRLLESISMTAC